jgi:hypothetical protein
VPEGEAGELVITTLTKQALPMLRYRTRDITRIDRAPCSCGRTHLRILRVTGRNDDMLIIRGVNVYPSQIEAVLVGRPGVAPHYQLVSNAADGRGGVGEHLHPRHRRQPGPRCGPPHQVTGRHHHRCARAPARRTSTFARQGGSCA